MQYKKWPQLPLTKLIPRIILGVLLTAIASQAFISFIIYIFIPLEENIVFNWTRFTGIVLHTFFILTIWTSIYLGVIFFRNKRREEIERLELLTSLQEAELAILKNQINPHFLFNALNNIRALILNHPEKARNMITHISELLRYSIQFNSSEKVSLSQELEIVENYLQLESMQFEERLSYEFRIEKGTLNVQIPPMSIQLLVENAIKHGISQLTTTGVIVISSILNNNQMSISVTNSGQLKKENKPEGIGLRNLMDRMKIIFGQFAEVSLENSSNNTVTASLKIPIS
ncbi:MAG: histidine kinase [Balneolaceae bacterium]|nr:histidine kinase [Balneolaceae bacterium]MBO6545015.1 histidine kinase [Balneolaceae bacterium]MBO6646411.1 histidine kinase [Balneolaceae bacterium]